MKFFKVKNFQIYGMSFLYILKPLDINQWQIQRGFHGTHETPPFTIANPTHAAKYTTYMYMYKPLPTNFSVYLSVNLRHASSVFIEVLSLLQVGLDKLCWHNREGDYAGIIGA